MYKKGNKYIVDNNRPVIILNNFSKIFEKALNVIIISFIGKQNILNEIQNGFRKRNSTI